VYEPDSRDTVVELADMPAPDAGAPLPLVVADDDNVILAFIISVDDPPTDEPPPGELFAVVRFRRRSAHFFGAPNDETLAGHPLYERGLRHYACAEVRSSSWIRQLERVNAVHRATILRGMHSCVTSSSHFMTRRSSARPPDMKYRKCADRSAPSLFTWLEWSTQVRPNSYS